jgi:lipopolysaccharide exporter
MSLKNQILGGVKFAGLSALLTNIVQLLQLVVLARLLEPADFGLMGMVLLVVTFIALFNDMGIGSAIIHRQEVKNESFTTLFWLTLFSGAVTFVLVWASTPLLALLFREPRLGLLLPVAALSCWLLPMTQLFRSLLEKELQFKHLSAVEVGASIAGLTCATALAVAGWGVWALVAGSLMNTGVQTILLFRTSLGIWRPGLLFDWRSAQGYVGFGMYLVGQKTVNFCSATAHFLVIGVLLGAQALGFYTVAYNLANMPSAKVNPVLSRVFFPVFAKAQEDIPTLKAGYLKMQEYVSLVNMPLLLGMAVSAPLAVPLILGSAWNATVPLLQVLCIVGLIRSVSGTIGPLLLARGRSDLGFRWSLLVAAIQIPAVIAGVKAGGALGVAVAFAISQAIIVAFNYLILIRTLLDPCLKAYLRTMIPALSMSLAMVTAMLAVSGSMTPGWFPLILQLVVGIAVYALLMWLFYKPFLLDVRALISAKQVT